MIGQALGSVFSSAAIPQKLVLAVLIAAIPIILIATALALRTEAQANPWRRLIAELRLIGPALGLLVGAMDSFHMGETIQRLPFDPTGKQLAPGILEVSTFIGAGALVGIVAAGAHLVLSSGARADH